MKILSPDFDYDRFLDKLSKTEDRMLLTDYDGTLAPFTIEREQAYPYPRVLEALVEIIEETNTFVAIISGRALADLLPLLEGFGKLPAIWGSHGWEHLSEAGVRRVLPLPPGIEEALKQAGKQVVSLGLESRMERKPASIAVHWRGLSQAQAASIERRVTKLWSQIPLGTGLAIHVFDGGLELRPCGRDKGKALLDIVGESLHSTTVLTLAYLGDDQTDEDAFEAIGREGLSVLVRKEFRSTAASLWLEPPEELESFFRDWRSACTES